MKREIENDSVELTISKSDAYTIDRALKLLENADPLSSVDFLSELESKGMENTLKLGVRVAAVENLLN